MFKAAGGFTVAGRGFGPDIHAETESGNSVAFFDRHLLGVGPPAGEMLKLECRLNGQPPFSLST